MAVHRYRAPAENGAVLADPPFDAIPALVEANRNLLDRTGVLVGGLSLRELRQLARREALELANEVSRDREGAGQPPSREATGPLPPGRGSPDVPLILAGHQPELSHPGVWAKNFALNGLARKLGGVPLHLVIDNDTLKSTSLRFPVFTDGDPTSVRLESLAFDTVTDEVPYEDRMVFNPEFFRVFAHRAVPLWANWGYEPLLAKLWAVTKNLGECFTEVRQRRDVVEDHPALGVWTKRLAQERCPDSVETHHGIRKNIGECFTAMRRACEREWGCHNLELPVSRLSQTSAFTLFAKHILNDLPRFRASYNTVIRAYRDANGIRSANHPAPDLAEGEAPFWVRMGEGKRQRATASSDVTKLRPRALTLTLFARVCLGDFFIHGIGGGKYDEVTDAIIRDYFGIEPPTYQVLSATLHLPLPAFPSTADDLTHAERRVRDLQWNPHRHLTPEQLANPDVRALVVAREVLVANAPPYGERREWYRALHAATERLRPFVAKEVPGAEAELRRVRSEVDANAILRRRDYPWVLYPEETLRPFLQRFL